MQELLIVISGIVGRSLGVKHTICVSLFDFSSLFSFLFFLVSDFFVSFFVESLHHKHYKHESFCFTPANMIFVFVSCFCSFSFPFSSVDVRLSHGSGLGF